MTLASSPFPHPIDHRVRAVIEKDGVYATFVTMSDTPSLFRTGRAVKVSGTIDGHPFEATLMPSGQDAHWLPLRAALCKAIGKNAAGQAVDIRLTERRS